MVKKMMIIAGLAVILLGPTVALVGVAVLINPATTTCTTNALSDGVGPGVVHVGPIPNALALSTADGERFTLNRSQLSHAATIMTVGNGIEGVDRAGIKIALIAALTESSLRQLANTGAYPTSGNYPNDGDASDHDSLGLFQMRPQAGWGTVAELMDPTYQAQAFFGGPSGPNYPSPRGLLDIPGWQRMEPGAAAQAVEVSAYPDRYRNYEPAADAIITALSSDTPTTTNATIGSTAPAAPESQRLEAARVVFPLPQGTWVMSSPFGSRVHPITGKPSFHTGTDFAAAAGTPIFAAADGIVTVAGSAAGYGHLIVIEHTINEPTTTGQTVATAYGHMYANGLHVRVGDTVVAGQYIGDVGSDGYSTGPHLHFEVRPGGTTATAVNPATWLNDHHAANLPEATGRNAARGCQNSGAMLLTSADVSRPYRPGKSRSATDLSRSNGRSVG